MVAVAVAEVVVGVEVVATSNQYQFCLGLSHYYPSLALPSGFAHLTPAPAVAWECGSVSLVVDLLLASPEEELSLHHVQVGPINHSLYDSPCQELFRAVWTNLSLAFP